MTTELTANAERILKATSYPELFGELGDDHQEQTLKKTYRRLARVVHPDRYRAEAEVRLAEQAFMALSRWYDQAKSALKNDHYGEADLLSITTKRAEHQLLRPLTSGDIGDLYESHSILKDGVEIDSVSKLARLPLDRDLLVAEASAIKRLRGPDSDPARHPFIPELIDSFAYGERGRPVRQVNVLTRLDGFCDLTQVHKAYPSGVIPLDMAWMWRRLLLVLGYAHRQGVVHGAVLPPHVMILPADHGLVLVDWCYSVTGDGELPPIKALVNTYRDWYPAEVLEKSAPSAATDIAMAARTMIYLMGGDPVTGNFAGSNIAKPFRAFFKGCLAAMQSARPDDAWLLIQEFDELLERLGAPYYPRRFRPFVMPTGTAKTP